ncbi:MAG: helicase-related protein [Nitrososphaerales archaeon]
MQYVSHPLIYPNTVEDRDYQRKIVEVASDKNTLIVLPTALGKTVISALIAAKILYNYRDKRVLVMAPTRPLCMQHKNTFQRIIRLPQDDFTLLTGKIPSDYREVVWKGSSRIIFATPQVVRNDILMRGLNLNNFGLLVFDECHRSVKEYAYTEIAQHYVKQSDYPLILGMTASPGSDIERVRMVCESLFIEHVEYRCDEDDDVRPYIQPIHVEWKRVNLPLNYQPLRDILRGMLDAKIKWLQSKGYLKDLSKNVTRKQLIELGAELRYNAEMSIEEERGPIYQAIIQQSLALTISHMLELLETQGAYTLKAFIEKMENNDKRSHAMLMREDIYGELLDLLNGKCYVEHPKVEMLKQVVKDQLTKNLNSRILVFTQFRDTATHLVEELNKLDNVKAERFVGQANRFGDKGLTQEQQASLIDDLRKGYLNTLVATSIAEEGLDIPEVDLVVFYEPIPSEIRYIQRRGRTGRKTAGRVVILATNDTYDMIYLYASSRRVKMMRSIASKLNSILKPVLRMKIKPALNPMTQEEILRIQLVSGLKREPLLVTSELEKFKDLSREIERAERIIYLKILEKGVLGLNDDELYYEMEKEGFNKGVVKAALSKLIKKKHVASEYNLLSIPIKSIPGARIMNVEIEKVMAGQAIVWVNGKWRARLLPENYNGPKEMIRKGSIFKALCELYHDSGVLCVKVRQVVQSL